MDDNQLSVLIDGREALPVRAIPYITGWQRFTPDVVAWYLAKDDERYTEWDLPLTAYRLAGGAPVAVMPREWNAVVVSLNGFEAETQELQNDQGNALWRSQAASKLPAGVFVWRDKFARVWRDWCKRTPIEFKRLGDDELTLAPPLLDVATRRMVLDGFTTAATRAVVVVKPNVSTKEIKPWDIPLEGDPPADQPWHTPARYFARDLIQKSPSLRKNINLLAQKVADTLLAKGYKKRGGKKPLYYTTILKAFTNVDFS